MKNQCVKEIIMIYDEVVIDGKPKAVFNVSKGLVNYSQRNNEYIWTRKKLIVKNTNTCNTTSICMGSSYAGWLFPKEPFSQYKQEEDRLTAFCLEDQRVSDFYKKKMPTVWAEWQKGEDKDALPPNQIHEILEYATNLWFGSTVVTFSDAMSLNSMFSQIVYNNLPVVISGVFPKASGSIETINHIVVMVGLIMDIEHVKNQQCFKEQPIYSPFLDTSNINNYPAPAVPDAIIFDDPWGNFIEGYEKMLPGNDIICPYDLAVKYLKPVNNKNTKWGYRFNKGASVI
jgi:hypothetical protein